MLAERHVIAYRVGVRINIVHVLYRDFIDQQGRLSVTVNYAYAATGGRLVVSDAGHPLMVYFASFFDVPLDQRAGFSGFGATHRRDAQVDGRADSRRQSTDMQATDDCNHRGRSRQDAIYDPESGEWVVIAGYVVDDDD